ncbi:MAG: hypothetical protein M3R01_13980, partial [Actinomycetota bacterium]|nr:hypothetical protein [Actinomycetota bacterium]
RHHAGHGGGERGRRALRHDADMDYETVAEAFLAPSAEGQRRSPEVGSHPARRLRDAVEPLATHGWWSRPANEAMAALGLDFFAGYVAGRAAALGDPPAEVVGATFAVFEPGFLASTWERARATAGRDEVLRAREEGTVASLEAILGDADGEAVERVGAALRRAVATLDATGRPLFSGLGSLPWPTVPLGVLWRGCELVREHRGDSHVAVCVAAGLDPVSMTVLTELWLGMPSGSYLATRGYGTDALEGALERFEALGFVEDGMFTGEGRAYRAELERRTDALQQGLVDALGDDLDEVLSRCDEWSAAVVAAGAFPPDPLKRAAG